MSWALYKGIRVANKPVVDEASCKGCNLCVWLCPPKALKLSEEFNATGYHYPVLAGTCTGCKVCEIVCPDFAIAIVEER